MADFAARDPGTAAFWDERYRAGFTPWDARGVPVALTQFLAASAPGRRVLVPGCGSAYEAGALDRAGFAVTAIDIAPEALARARDVLGADIADRVLRLADFFTLDAAYDWIYERALLCALPSRLWPDYAAAAARLLSAGGLLAGIFFVDDTAGEPRRGPPFAAHRAELDALLAPKFECVADAPVPEAESLPVFARRERWMTWRRRDDAARPRG